MDRWGAKSPKYILFEPTVTAQTTLQISSNHVSFGETINFQLQAKLIIHIIYRRDGGS